ncbi:exopolygalacturonase [Quercus suber]|uniref:Exopolygalacturonase n=1 Tax=Quercus suber TaxID=58331 RepID=A0AAW0IZ63_QUESU
MRKSTLQTQNNMHGQPVENEEIDTPLFNHFIVDIEKIKHLHKGTLQAPSDVASFNDKDGWVVFEHINGLTVSGGGVFDGKGQLAREKK